MALQQSSRGRLNLYLQYADLDGQAVAGGGPPLAALWRTVLPTSAAVQELWLEECAIHNSSFSGCAPLLASVTELRASCCGERASGTDAALRRALDALIALAPNLRCLEILNYTRLGEANPGWTLTAGPPPALLALRHLESLCLESCMVPTLPEGPYLSGALGRA